MSKQEAASEGIPAAEAPAKRPPLNKYALACAVLASMNSILLGYDISVMSGAQLFMKQDLKISDTQIEVLAGIINIYSLVGSLSAGRTSDWIGRRYTMVLAAAIFFTGALIMGLAPSYAILMLGRFVAGVGVGYALMIAPVYTAEVAPTSARGLLTSFPEVFINTGVLLGYVSNYAFHSLPVHLSWRVMFLVGAAPPVFLALGVLSMPESPRWLAMQGRIGDARRVLAKTSDSTAEAEERLADIKRAIGIPEGGVGDSDDDDVVVVVPRKNRGTHGEGVWRDLLIRPTPPVRRILIACLGLQFFQQASGIDSVVTYSPRVFEKAGLQSDSNSLGATMAVGAAKTLFILVATFFLDRVGRRPLLLTSAGGMVVSLVTLASALHAIDRLPEGQATPLVGVSTTGNPSFWKLPGDCATSLPPRQPTPSPPPVPLPRRPAPLVPSPPSRAPCRLPATPPPAHSPAVLLRSSPSPALPDGRRYVGSWLGSCLDLPAISGTFFTLVGAAAPGAVRKRSSVEGVGDKAVPWIYVDDLLWHRRHARGIHALQGSHRGRGRSNVQAPLRSREEQRTSGHCPRGAPGEQPADSHAGHRRRPPRREAKRPGQTISKGHRNYGLMLQLQL